MAKKPCQGIVFLGFGIKHYGREPKKIEEAEPQKSNRRVFLDEEKACLWVSWFYYVKVANKGWSL